MAKWFYKKTGIYDEDDNIYIVDAFETSVEYGQVEIAKWLYELRENITTCGAFKISCKYEQIELAEWFYNLHDENVNIFPGASKNSRENISDFLTNVGIDDSRTKTFLTLCVQNHIELLKWTSTMDKFDDDNSLGVPDILKNMCGKFISESDLNETMYDACKYGRIKIVKWLYDIGVRLSKNLFKLACNNNHIKLAKWLHEINSYSKSPNIKINMYKIFCCACKKWLF